MRGFEIPLTIASALLTMAVSPPERVMDFPGYEEPSHPWTSVEEAEERKTCRDRIERARAEARKPPLDNAPADADKPILHYAVDRRVDGCRVLVPVADPGKMLPVPETGRAKVIPAEPKN